MCFILLRLGKVPLSPAITPPDSPSPPSSFKRARRSDESIISASSHEDFSVEDSHSSLADAPSSSTQGQAQRALVPTDEAADMAPELPQVVSEELRGFVDSTMQAANKHIHEFVDTIARMPPADDDVEMAGEAAFVNKRSRDYAFPTVPGADNAVDGKIEIYICFEFAL